MLNQQLRNRVRRFTGELSGLWNTYEKLYFGMWKAVINRRAVARNLRCAAPPVPRPHGGTRTQPAGWDKLCRA